MASIKEEGTRGKRLSYKFRVCLGRDESGRQISKAMRWNPPEDMTPAKARKEAQRVAAVWEAEQKEAFERQKARQEGRKTNYTFGQFVDEVWIPLCVRDGSHRPSTVAMYTNILKVMRPHFEELLLSGISGIQITQYLTWLRNDYRTQYGKPLAEKSIKHHYNILSFIFGYAEKQDLIEKNPMKKVDAPKVRRRAVDALSEEDARRFFEELNALDFDFRCILQLLITTGLRRGECIGLQWQDVDFDNRKMTFLHQLPKACACSYRCFHAFPICLPETNIVQQFINVIVKSLLAFLGAPHLNAIFDKPFNYKWSFISNSSDAVEHENQ